MNAKSVFRRLGGMVNRATVNLINDKTKTQQLQVEVLSDEARDQVEHMQPVGFKSVPLPGSESIVLAVGGNGDHRVSVVVHDKRSRPTNWEPGDVGLYHPKTGHLIHMRADGSIEITTQTLTITAPTVRIEGNLQVSGEVSDSAGSMKEMRTRYNLHNHSAEGTSPPTPTMD